MIFIGAFFSKCSGSATGHLPMLALMAVPIIVFIYYTKTYNLQPPQIPKLASVCCFIGSPDLTYSAYNTGNLPMLARMAYKFCIYYTQKLFGCPIPCSLLNVLYLRPLIKMFWIHYIHVSLTNVGVNGSSHNR